MHSEIESLLDFITETPTCYHIHETTSRIVKQSINTISTSLNKSQEKNIVLLQAGGAIALLQQKKITSKTRFHIWGAHSDSPSLKLRANCNQKKNNINLLKTEIYGGPIINSWLDRSLGLAGRVYYKQEKQIQEKLVIFKESLLTIPNAAIHINREINKGLTLNREKHLSAFLSCRDNTLEGYLGKQLQTKKENILSYDLQLIPLAPPALMGVEQEFIHSPRLDNLLMCHAGLMGFIQNAKKNTFQENVIPIVVFFNHEEIGSRTHESAASNFLINILKELLEEQNIKNRTTILKNSFFISADVAHAFHPAYSELYEEGNNILFEKGIVIKHSSNHHYVSEGPEIATIKNLLLNNEISFQESNSHGEIPCGSTIGPIVNSTLGIKTLDVGSPLLAMHSIRELASVKDHLHMTRLATSFLQEQLSAIE